MIRRLLDISASIRSRPARRVTSPALIRRPLAISFAWPMAFLLALPGLGLAQSRDEYAAALRRSGFADLAVGYLERELTRPGLSPAEKGSIEYEIGASLLADSDAKDIAQRDRRLDSGRARLAAFVRQYPNDPRRRDAQLQLGLANLQQGRLRVLQSQLPANAASAVRLADEARELFRTAARDYAAAADGFDREYADLPLFVPEEDVEGRKRKSELFALKVESRFQATVSRFWLADSYLSVEIPNSDPKKPGVVHENVKLREQWQLKVKEEIESARKGFADLEEKYRREYVGLYSRLWMARCMALQADYRSAAGIFEELLAIDNRDLEPFKREVFHFKLMMLAARREFESVAGQGEVWLSRNSKFARESAFQGVMFEVAKALVANGDALEDGPPRNRLWESADRYFERVSASGGNYSALARREQLGLAEKRDRDLVASNFRQLASKANARLDALKPDLSPGEKRRILSEAKAEFRKALASVKPTDDPDRVHEARLALAFACLQDDELIDAAVIAETVCLDFPAAKPAAQAGYFAMGAWAMAYDRAAASGSTGGGFEAGRLRRMAEYLARVFPSGKESVDGALLVAKVELNRRDYAGAVSTLSRIPRGAPKYGDVRSLLGRTWWDWYKSDLRTAGVAPATLKERRTNGLEILEASADELRSAHKGIDRERFLHELYLAEAQLDANRGQPGVALAPLVDAIAKNALAADIEGPLRIELLATALESTVRAGKPEDADRLMEIIDRQSDGKANTSARVFLRLAAQTRERLDSLKAAGDTAAAEALKGTFEKFLDRVAGRPDGQGFQNLLFIAENLFELGRHQRTAELVERALAEPEAADDAKRNMVLRARLLLAKSRSALGEHEKAVDLMNRLWEENSGVREFLAARGAILEAAGDLKAAANHYRGVVVRLVRQNPKPDEFYLAVDETARITLKLDGDDRAKRLTEIHFIINRLLKADPGLSEERKARLTERFKELEAALGR